MTDQGTPLTARDLARVRDPWRRLATAGTVLQNLRREQERATALRDAAIVRLCGQGVSYQHIAEAAGLTRGRVAQIIQRSRASTA